MGVGSCRCRTLSAGPKVVITIITSHTPRPNNLDLTIVGPDSHLTRTQQHWVSEPGPNNFGPFLPPTMTQSPIGPCCHQDPTALGRPTTMTWHLIEPFCHQDLTSLDSFSNQDPTAWAMYKATPNALGPARRPGPTMLGGSVSFKIWACNWPGVNQSTYQVNPKLGWFGKKLKRTFFFQMCFFSYTRPFVFS